MQYQSTSFSAFRQHKVPAPLLRSVPTLDPVLLLARNHWLLREPFGGNANAWA